MKTRKLIYLALFSASTALSPSLMTGVHPALFGQADTCQYCPAQLVSPSISFSQLFL